LRKEEVLMKKSTLSLYAYGTFCLAAIATPVLFGRQIDSLNREGMQLVLTVVYSVAVALIVCLGASLLRNHATSKKLHIANQTAEKAIADSSYVSRREEVLKEVFLIRCTMQGQVPDMRHYDIWRDALIRANNGLIVLRHKLEKGLSITLPTIPREVPEAILNRTLRSTVEQAFSKMRTSPRV
jgi:hypothetical protein